MDDLTRIARDTRSAISNLDYKFDKLLGDGGPKPRRGGNGRWFGSRRRS